MCELKWLLRTLVIVFVVEGCHLISTRSRNGTAEILWSLTGRSLERFPGGYPYRPYPYPGLPPVTLGFMDALASIAHNDELHCVPRLLCELTSGSNSIQLPFNINMHSLLGLLSSLNGGGGSPLVLFGRAALLGYTSNGNSAPCLYSYPRCPTDPDKLVNYLNNYNGGFFRYFNGVPRPQGFRAQGRIQTQSATSTDRFRIKFPVDNFYKHKSPRTLTFPQEQTLPVFDGLDFQRPLPNHIASPFIFPSRTGTGEFILDSDTF